MKIVSMPSEGHLEMGSTNRSAAIAAAMAARSPAPNTNQPDTGSEPSPSRATSAVTESPKVEDQLSSKYAEFAKREQVYRRKVQAQQQALKAREDALKAKEQEYTTQYVPKNQISERFKQDPYQAMQEFGLSGEELTQALLQQPSPQDAMIRQLKAEISELQQKFSQTKSTLEENDTRQTQQALNQIKADVKSLVQSNAETFDLIRSTNSEDSVVEYIEKQFEKDGTLISLEEAAEAVEAELTEELVKYAQLNKVQQRLKTLLPAAGTAAASESSPEKSASHAYGKSPVKTLAHSQVTPSTKPMSARERAIALLEGKL